jgi:hypothetical protein
MAIQVDSTKAALANTYVNLGQFFGLATNDPGTNAHPDNEATGNTYSRAQPTQPWLVNDAGVAIVQCTINADGGGIIYTHAILCSDMNGDTMIDNCPIGGDMGVKLSGDGQIVLDVTYTQS